MTAKSESLLVATGRKPNIQGLGLEAAGVDFDRKGIKADASLTTSKPHIFACGDIVGPYQFTHTADYQARIVVRNILFPWKKAKADYTWVPWVTYTDPEVAQVGLTEEEAKAKEVRHIFLSNPQLCVAPRYVAGSTQGRRLEEVESGSRHIILTGFRVAPGVHLESDSARPCSP